MVGYKVVSVPEPLPFSIDDSCYHAGTTMSTLVSQLHEFGSRFMGISRIVLKP